MIMSLGNNSVQFKVLRWKSCGVERFKKLNFMKDLEKTKLKGTDLIGADLKGVDLKEFYFERTDFRETKI